MFVVENLKFPLISQLLFSFADLYRYFNLFSLILRQQLSLIISWSFLGDHTTDNEPKIEIGQ